MAVLEAAMKHVWFLLAICPYWASFVLIRGKFGRVFVEVAGQRLALGADPTDDDGSSLDLVIGGKEDNFQKEGSIFGNTTG